MLKIDPRDIITADEFAQMDQHRHLLPAGRNTLRNNARGRKNNGLEDYGGLFTRNGKLYVNVPKYLCWFARVPLDELNVARPKNDG